MVLNQYKLRMVFPNYEEPANSNELKKFHIRLVKWLLDFKENHNCEFDPIYETSLKIKVNV